MSRKKRKTGGKAAMRRFEEFAKRVFSVTRDDLKKAEEEAEEIIEWRASSCPQS